MILNAQIWLVDLLTDECQPTHCAQTVWVLRAQYLVATFDELILSLKTLCIVPFIPEHVRQAVDTS